jgi:hypothetical protein
VPRPPICRARLPASPPHLPRPTPPHLPPAPGELKAYLDELEADEGRALERWFYTDWLRSRQRRREQAAELAEWRQRTASGGSTAGGAGAEGREMQAAEAQRGGVSVATEERPAGEEQQQRRPAPAPEPQPVPPAEDPSQMPAFLSLDNPIILTFAVLAMSAALSALLARVQELAALQ